MVEWFNNLTDANKIAIVVPVGLALLAGLFGLFKWLSGKKDGPAPQGAIIAPPIDPNNVLDRSEIPLQHLPQSKEQHRKQ